jgi:hypothetical protein
MSEDFPSDNLLRVQARFIDEYFVRGLAPETDGFTAGARLTPFRKLLLSIFGLAARCLQE